MWGNWEHMLPADCARYRPIQRRRIVAFAVRDWFRSASNRAQIGAHAPPNRECSFECVVVSLNIHSFFLNIAPVGGLAICAFAERKDATTLAAVLGKDVMDVHVFAEEDRVGSPQLHNQEWLETTRIATTLLLRLVAIELRSGAWYHGAMQTNQSTQVLRVRRMPDTLMSMSMRRPRLLAGGP